ncbi:hypothetical protein GCM10022393_26270 [Aquimarina addita]|uniref:Uncharacterized protein n=2 Tax=Aquimarina addita TaxID=870485 RepID=A0ABP6ULD0_9FLAO
MMKKILLPLILISFAIITLGFIHIDNVNKLDQQYNDLRDKQQKNNTIDTENSKMFVSDIK